MELVFPLVETVRAMGGAARPRDAVRALVERVGLREDLLDRTAVGPSGETVRLLRRHIHFARLKAVKLGYFVAGERGKWQLPDEAVEGLAAARAGVIVTIVPGVDGLPAAAQVRLAIGLPRLDTIHSLVRGDARRLTFLDDGSVQLVVTSVPYHDLVAYNPAPGQLGGMASYGAFLLEMERALAEMHRVLEPGGRACINVGDVLRSRKRHGRHHILPLHAHLLVAGERVGFDVLNGITWRKLGNIHYEGGGNGILGQPGQPNQVLKLEHEHILLLRKQGPYQKTTAAQRDASRITKDEHRRWFREVWDDIPGARADAAHPAPFPVEVPYRLIRMFSHEAQTVLDPFGGKRTTAKAAMLAGRHSVTVDVSYLEEGLAQVTAQARKLAA